jgi:hypothetical protein
MTIPWQSRLLHGGRSGLSGGQRDLAAKYAAMLQRKEPMTRAELQTAMAIASCCGNPNRVDKRYANLKPRGRKL